MLKKFQYLTLPVGFKLRILSKVVSVHDPKIRDLLITTHTTVLVAGWLASSAFLPDS